MILCTATTHSSLTTLEITVEFHDLISHDVTKIMSIMLNVNKADVDDDKSNR